jgi:hypothetical protein
VTLDSALELRRGTHREVGPSLVLRTRKLIGEPFPGSNTGGSVHFFPDGKHVLGVFSSGTGIVWNVDPAAWKAKACRVARRNLTQVEWTEFLGRRSYRSVCP